MKTITFSTPFGPMYVEEEAGKITAVGLGERRCADAPTPLLLSARKQLEEYFAGRRRVFELPLGMSGTAFQVAVWESLITIPYGETVSYAEIAARIGNKNACRAVGGACSANPLMIVVPCHRVIGQDGRFVGFGSGLPVKAELLRLEKGFLDKWPE
ncbi:MAG TPA: methylated-DNA--[protein]-cysteine S-methyltransferase [Acholeplasmataceae bacterium]|nr:methylated-DNA--[protein]-cysteine S-methyltransferase [Acholeplasmataceae bacterium]